MAGNVVTVAQKELFSTQKQEACPQKKQKSFSPRETNKRGPTGDWVKPKPPERNTCSYYSAKVNKLYMH